MARQLVGSMDEAIRNVLRYATELHGSPDLQRRIGNVSAWYAISQGNGEYHFAPSKFIGYANLDAAAYLDIYDAGLDGRETERRLSNWFKSLPADAPLAQQLRIALDAFVGRFGRSIKKTARINVLKSEAAKRQAQAAGRSDLAARIVSDADICGGRPRIRGTRMRVSDVLDLLAAGVATAEILADYPYLSEQDVAAAIDYAARALNHRVIRAA